MTSPRSILVTGCAGFIGSAFSREFRKRYPETEVVGVDNFSSGRRDAVAPGVVLFDGSVTDALLLEQVFLKHKPEYIFHFAAIPRVSYSVEHPAESTEANIFGTVLLLEKARDHKVRRFIFSSSSSIYGPGPALPTTEAENPPAPVSPYGLQKVVGERFLKMASDLYGIDTVALRYFNVFGPGQYGDSPYSTVVSAWLTGLYVPDAKKPFLEGDGTQSKDYCYVDNVVEANMLAMKHGARLDGDVFNVANNEQTSLMEIKSLIEEYTGRTLELERRPTRAGDVPFSRGSFLKANTTFGYTPGVDFKTGLKKTVEWFEERITNEMSQEEKTVGGTLAVGV